MRKLLLVVLPLFACARAPATTATSPMRGSSGADAHLEIRWFRTSAEYRALTRQTYRYAAERLPELSRGLAPRGWAVIVDADETVLDNSVYQERRAPLLVDGVVQHRFVRIEDDRPTAWGESAGQLRKALGRIAIRLPCERAVFGGGTEPTDLEVRVRPARTAHWRGCRCRGGPRTREQRQNDEEKFSHRPLAAEAETSLS